MVLKKENKDRRKAQRLSIPLNIEYKVFPKLKIIKQKLSDISGSGFKLALGHPLRQGERLKTLIYFPEEPLPITAFSEVVRCKTIKINNKKRFNIGLKYLKIIPKDRYRFISLFCEMMVNYFVLGRAK